MKTRLAILLALASTGAYAQLPVEVPVPGVPVATAQAKLFPSEQGAFKLLEVVSQLLEGKAVQNNGCSTVAYPLEVHTTYDGSGYAVVGNGTGSVRLDIALGKANVNLGRWYTVASAGGSLNTNGITTYSNIKAQGSFNIGSSIQEVSTEFDASSAVTRSTDHFNGTVIKDYVRLVDLVTIPAQPIWTDVNFPVEAVIDYGYQQISKNKYVKAKWWQQSITWRDDGVNAGTWWYKTRVVPAGCSIEIKIAGYGESPADDIEGFNEKGTVTVGSKTATPIGPFLKGGNGQ